MQASTVSLAFALLLLAGLATRFWLTSRQIRHVASHRDRVPEPFAQTVTLQAHRKAADYTLARGRLNLLQQAFGAAVLLGWTLLGGLDALNIAVREATLGPWGPLGYQLALLAAFTLIGSLLELPLEAWNTFRIEQRFGFNRMTPRLWLADLLRGALVTAVLGLPLAALVLALMAAAGPWWWLWAWGVWMGFNLLMLVIYPTWIAPLFNRFEPLADATLRERVTALMRRCGFSAQGLFVMDGSRRSAHANAYFTGLGRAKRVVFYDTLLQRLTGSEVEAVLAHELGHFHHRHVLKRLVTMFALSLGGLALLGWLAGNSAFYAGLGVQPAMDAPNDALALLLFSLVLPLAGFFLSPVASRAARRHEFEADRYACEHADGGALAMALLKLHQDNATTLTPDPVYARFYYTHPPASQRLAALPSPSSAQPA
jgi:STE24 endopeptidase